MPNRRSGRNLLRERNRPPILRSPGTSGTPGGTVGPHTGRSRRQGRSRTHNSLIERYLSPITLLGQEPYSCWKSRSAGCCNLGRMLLGVAHRGTPALAVHHQRQRVIGAKPTDAQGPNLFYSGFGYTTLLPGGWHERGTSSRLHCCVL